MRELVNKTINKGIYNAPNLEVIPRGAASDALGFITTFKGIELVKGKVRLGDLSTGGGSVPSIHFGYKASGTAVAFKQTATAVQYYDPADLTWKNTITGLTAGNHGTFTDVVGLAGNFVFFFSRDGIWKIPVANPSSAIDMYDEAINYKGNALFDSGRHYLWNREKDTTGLYLSNVDEANYTTISAESVGTGDGTTDAFSGTLAGVAARRTLFGIVITDGVETFTDDLSGGLTGSLGGTGTINYATGAYSITFNTAPVNAAALEAEYQWENSNNGGVTDFTYGSPRVAGEGDVLRQDEGGDAIQVVHALESSHFSFKKQRIYKLTLDDADTTGNNRVFRSGVGMTSRGASTPTSAGIVFLNTFNPDNPELHILERNPLGDNFNTRNLTPQFNYSSYTFDECVMDSFGDYVIFSGKTSGASANDRLFAVNLKLNSVDVLPYHADSFAKDAGFLYIGDSISNNVYQVLSGSDDDGHEITASWVGNEEEYGSEQQKRQRYVRFGGFISTPQSYLVEVSYDNGDFQEVGTIEGSGSYVDGGSPHLIGSDMIGSVLIGGEGQEVAYPYIREFKINSPKFRKRVWKITPQGLGYVNLQMIHDLDIMFYTVKLPSKYR